MARLMGDVWGDVWLSDDIIHVFLNQTAVRGIQQNYRVLCLNSQLRITTDNPKYTWAQLHRRQLKNVNVGGAHWVLAHSNLTSNTMTVYDSFQDPVIHIAEVLSR